MDSYVTGAIALFVLASLLVVGAVSATRRDRLSNPHGSTPQGMVVRSSSKGYWFSAVACDLMGVVLLVVGLTR